MNLTEELNENLVEFFDRFTSWENSVIQQGSLTVAGAHAIEKLGHNGSMSMKDLSKSLGVTTGTITVTVDRLEKGGYAVRDRSESDRRSYIIRLTEKGKEAFFDHHSHHMSLSDEIASILSEDEVKSLVRILEKINKTI
ncbi:MarR family winged helix-turn-helix transcriptional regulator [Methanomicrobium antiquum]|uniref:MarR family winged helix-turn-helix transcriptional regulator n=1 Tax=Methanomicrobium antiquum TaxID=487686 RepID=A0AAF0FNH3_9EURY|nr:MarR family winged helix-turn-helix transcriptional regulator [Methanomicrobium antiquum]MDD3407372.1 MarR family winged helix-turn-helix transcriptional regulator [Methanomicrobium sp.]MDD4300551.1 MarR family winged helix-turn-helix transcriptional regulator [Methanomicrobium sp.]WFN36712.1 MarR family winged helix-turn-helix transcriptional regulator [Methanomicrobium antiquum]